MRERRRFREPFPLRRRSKLVEAPARVAPRRILLVGDDETERAAVAEPLAGSRYAVDPVATADAALDALRAELYAVVLLDLHLPGVDGLGVLDAATSLQADAQYIVMATSGAVDLSVEAMKRGARGYILKPVRADELLLQVERACSEAELRREVARLRRNASATWQRGEHEMIRRATDEAWTIQRLEREYVLAVVEKTGGHRGNAAKLLGIDRRTLYRKLRAIRRDADPHEPR